MVQLCAKLSLKTLKRGNVMPEGKITTNHDEIKKWVESRGGRPVKVKGTGRGSDVGLLRIDFPGFGNDENFEQLSWDEFFEKFDENHLAFLHQDETSGGDVSRFNKFVSRGSAKTKGKRKAH